MSQDELWKKMNKTDSTGDGFQQIVLFILLIQAKHQRLLIVLSGETGQTLTKLQAASIPRRG